MIKILQHLNDYRTGLDKFCRLDLINLKLQTMKNFLIALNFFLLFSCGQNDKGVINDDLQKEVKSTIDNYYNELRKKGLAAELKYLDSSNQFFWVPPGYMNYANFNVIAAAIKRNAASLKSIDNRYDSLLIIPLTNDYAQFVMRTISTTIRADGDSIKSAFIESGVMVRRKDGWKFLSGQTSLLQ
jgi:hypothetical protein